MIQQSVASEKWSPIKRLGSLLSIYFLFLIFDFTSSDELYPHFVYQLMQFYTNFWDWIVPWTGKHILHLSYPITVKPNGSGDTTYNYVLQLLWIFFTVILAVAILFIDRKRESYAKWDYWLRIVVRYFFAYMLFVYGFVKVIKLQFPFPDLNRLTETYGESSPMGLAWAFVGYSPGYNYFTGGAEVLAGMLLFFKRTTLLGTVLAMTIMGNVVAMNMAYDIPVKIFSMNMLLTAIWIAWYDKDRLISVFITHRAIPEKPEPAIFHTRWKKILQLSLKTLVIFFAFYATFWTCLSNAAKYGDGVPKPPLYGIYDVVTFIRDGKTVLPLTTDSSRWKRVIINYDGVIRVNNMLGIANWMRFELDTIKANAKFSSFDDSTQFYHMHYRVIESNNPKSKVKGLAFQGKIGKDSIQVTMKGFDINKLLLVNRGFHWINEESFNR